MSTPPARREAEDCVFHLDRGWRYAPVSYKLSIVTVASQCLLNGATHSFFLIFLFNCEPTQKDTEMLLIPEIWASRCCVSFLIGRSSDYNQQTKNSHGKYLQSCVLKYQNSFSIFKEKHIFFNFFNLAVQVQLTFFDTFATYPPLNLSDLAQGLIYSLFKGSYLKNMKQVLKQKDISTTWRKK